MSAHTKGSWSYRHMGQHSYGVLTTVPGVVGPTWIVQHTSSEADARLIAAAPTLLYALTHLVDAYSVSHSRAVREAVWAEARAAIAAATGEQP